MRDYWFGCVLTMAMLLPIVGNAQVYQFFTPAPDISAAAAEWQINSEPIVVAGHGEPWAGGIMRERLAMLAGHFDELERPSIGRYSRQPALADETGVVMLPRDPLPGYLAGAGAMLAAAGLVWVAASGGRREAHLPAGSAHR